VPFEVACANGARISFRRDDVAAPDFVGVRVLDDYPLDEIAKYIDWTFFFTAWELGGKFPDILQHPERGGAARELYAAGKRLLARIIDEKLLVARGVYGFFPANGQKNDIVLYTTESRKTELVRFDMLRQQTARTGEDERYLSLADFVAPDLPDHVGAFAVTAGVGADVLAKKFEKELDDYNAILVKALADRLAEAFAELLHAKVRTEWGYGKEERLTNEDLIAEKYRGIRPAFGYPACPDHTEKAKLWDILGARRVGMELTEHFAMTPAASVSGIYLAHPEARYFTVGKVDRDQVEDYARRKGMTVAEVERWLAPNLGYDPAQKAAGAAA
jgi:5-methyltetrahydrofolate--homocysteine methyltransferase